MKLIETIKLASPQASITFSALPTTGIRAFVVIGRLRTTSGGSLDNGMYVRLNGATTSYESKTTYFYTSTGGRISGTSSNIHAGYRVTGGAAPYSSYSTFQATIQNPSSTEEKNVLTQLSSDAESNTFRSISAGTWSSGSAVTSITVYADSSWATNTSLSIYMLEQDGNEITVS